MKKIIKLIAFILICLVALPTGVVRGEETRPEVPIKMKSVYSYKNFNFEYESGEKMAESDIRKYDVYDIVLPHGEKAKVESLLALCEIAPSTGTSGEEGMDYSDYTSEELQKYLHNFKEFNFIQRLYFEGEPDLLYINYFTVDDKEVTLAYDAEGMMEKFIYDEAKDEGFFITPEVGVHYENFREGFPGAAKKAAPFIAIGLVIIAGVGFALYRRRKRTGEINS